MSTSYETRYASSPQAVKHYDTSQLRAEFLIDNLMEEGKIKAYGASLDTHEEMILLMNTTNAKVIEAF